MAELRRIGDLGQGLFRFRGGAFKHFFAVKLHSICRAAQQLGTQLADLFPQLHGTLLSGLAGNVGGTGCIGTGVIGRGIGVGTKYRNVVQRAVQHFGGDLRQRGVTAGAHIRCTDDQRVESIIVQLEGRTAHVHAGNTGALHGHAHADGAHLAVAQITGRVFVLPVDHLPHLDKTAVQRTAGVHGTVVGRHHIALLHSVLQAQGKGVHVQLVGQLVHGRFHSKQALSRTVAAVGTGRHVVGIHHIADKAERFGLTVQRDGFVAGQAYGRGAVLAIGTGVGQRVQVDSLHDAILRGTQPDVHLHFVARRGGRLTFHPAENDLGGLFGFPGHKGGVYLADRCLLGTKAAAHPGLGNTHHGFGDVQGIGNVAPRMEHDLGGAEHVQPPISVNGTIGAEGLHHSLLAGLGVIHPVDDHVTASQHSVDISAAALVVGAEVPLVVGPYRAQGLPVVLRVHQNRVVLGGVEVHHRLQHLVLHLDELEGLVHALFVLTGHNGHHITHETDVAVDDQSVTGACLREGLACLGVAGRILRDILPGEDGFNAGNLLGHGRVDRPDHGVCMRRAQQLDDQAVLRDHIIHIDRLAGDQLHGVLFAERFVDRVHSAAASFCFFQSRKFRMPRSWPS